MLWTGLLSSRLLSFYLQEYVPPPSCCHTKPAESCHCFYLHGRWNRFSFEGFKCSMYISKVAMPQCGPGVSSIIPPFKPSSCSRQFFVSSLIIFQIYLLLFASVITAKSLFLSWQRFCLPRRQKYSIISKNMLFWSVTGLFMSQVYNFWRSSGHSGCLCSTLARPCGLSSTHFTAKTLLAS